MMSLGQLLNLLFCFVNSHTNKYHKAIRLYLYIKRLENEEIG